MPFRCGNCRAIFPAWTVACPGCKAVDWLYAVADASPGAARSTADAPPFGKLSDVMAQSTRFLLTGWPALDAVLGGGLAQGATYLLAGSPGAGKSTLALTIASFVSPSRLTLYVSGEEMTSRLLERARRLSLGCAALDVCVLTELGALSRVVRAHRHRLVVVDSLNVLTSDRLRSRVGSPSQLLNSGIAIARLARSTGATFLVIGHVTKSNQLSGPRSVEHYCDAMLHFNASGKSPVRTLIASKNRFGPAHVPIRFVMSETGLYPESAEIARNPSFDESRIVRVS